MLIHNENSGTLRYSQALVSCNEAQMEKLTWTVPEAAKALGIGRTAAYEAARTGQIPAVRIGRRVLIPVAALENFVSGLVNKEPSGGPEISD